jgi:sugar phosphate permease
MPAETSKHASTEDLEEKLAGPPSEVVPAGPEHDELYIDPVREAKLVRKLDIRIAPVMCAVFLLAYLDRSNIGNAAAAGLAETANLKGNQLNIAITLFYATYVLTEWPGTILMKKIRPSIFFSGLMVCWGLTTLFSGFVVSQKRQPATLSPTH